MTVWRLLAALADGVAVARELRGLWRACPWSGPAPRAVHVSCPRCGCGVRAVVDTDGQVTAQVAQPVAGGRP